MFRLFTKDKTGSSQTAQVHLDFEPVLNLFLINDTNGNDSYMTLRVASGDENNINKNRKIKAQDIQEITLEIQGFTELTGSSAPSVQHIKGTSILKIVREDHSVEDIELAKHCIAVTGRKTKSKNKQGAAYTWPSPEIIKKEVNDIWQDVFADALADYVNDTGAPSGRVRQAEGSPWLTRISIAIIILSLLVTVSSLAMRKFSHPATATETAMEQFIPPAGGANSITETNDPDQEALTEFGLDAGIKLE